RGERRPRPHAVRGGAPGRRGPGDPGRWGSAARRDRHGRRGNPGQRRRSGARAARPLERGAPRAACGRPARRACSQRSLPSAVGAFPDRPRPARSILAMGRVSDRPPLRVHARGAPAPRGACGLRGARGREFVDGRPGARHGVRRHRAAAALGASGDRVVRQGARRRVRRSLPRRAVRGALRPKGRWMSIHVMHAITRLTLGGSSENTIASCVALARAGYRCTLATSFAESDATSLADARHRGCRVVDVPSLGREVAPLTDLASLRQLAGLIRSERPAIVQTHTSKAGFVGRLAARITRVPGVIHQPHGHIFYGYYGARRTALFIALERLAAKWTDRIITLTE